MQKLLSSFLTILLVLIIYSAAFFIQHQTLLNWDVSLLMHTTDRLLHGGKYGIDFFETMPPMILYVYSIPVIASYIFSTNFITTSFLFTFAISIFSLILSDYFIKNLESRKNIIYKRIILLPAVAVIMLLPPAYEFSQREHLMLMLILPFLFATVARIEKIKINHSLALVVGLLAGIGFCIKPQFLLCFLFIEALYFENNKKIRPETLVITGIVIAYSLSIVLFHKTYLTLVLPAILTYYYQGKILTSTIQECLTFPPFYISLFSCGLGYFFILCRKENIFLEKMLTICIFIFCIIYLIQYSPWLYHTLPAFSLSLLLLIQIFHRLFLWIHLKNTLFKLVFTILFSCVTFYFPIKMIYQNTALGFSFGKNNILVLYGLLAHFPKTSEIYFFINSGYPAVDYLPFKNLQFMQNDWFTSGIIAKTQSHSPDNLCQNPLIQRFIKDFIEKNPQIIVLDRTLHYYSAFEIVRVFSQDKNFRTQFQQYTKIAQFNYLDIYVKKDLTT